MPVKICVRGRVETGVRTAVGGKFQPLMMGEVSGLGPELVMRGSGDWEYAGKLRCFGNNAVKFQGGEELGE